MFMLITGAYKTMAKYPVSYVSVKFINPFSLRVPLEIFVWIFDNFDNNLGTKNSFPKH